MNVDDFDIDAFIEEELTKMEEKHPRNRKLSEELTRLYNNANIQDEVLLRDLNINEDTLAEVLYASPTVSSELTKSVKEYLLQNSNSSQSKESILPKNPVEVPDTVISLRKIDKYLPNILKSAIEFTQGNFITSKNRSKNEFTLNFHHPFYGNDNQFFYFKSKVRTYRIPSYVPSVPSNNLISQIEIPNKHANPTPKKILQRFVQLKINEGIKNEGMKNEEEDKIFRNKDQQQRYQRTLLYKKG